MAESKISVTEGSGKNLHTYDRTVSSVLVQDQFMVPGEYPLPSYTVVATVATNTANDHVLQLMAASSVLLRIRRISMVQAVNATAPLTVQFQVLRLTTAGTGGTAVTPRPFDAADAAASSTAMTLPTGKGTESATLFTPVLTLRQALSTTTGNAVDSWTWEQHPGTKPIVVAAGTSNGIAIKNLAGFGAAGQVAISVEYVESSY